MISNLKSTGFSFFEKATGLMAEAAYGVVQITFEEGNGRLVTAKTVSECYADANNFLELYDSKDIVSIDSEAQGDAFQSAKSIATIVTKFAKYISCNFVSYTLIDSFISSV